MNREVFLSLLALDAYNRGYGENLRGLDVPRFDLDGNPIDEIRIGTATISEDSSRLGETTDGRIDAEAGFYAIA